MLWQHLWGLAWLAKNDTKQKSSPWYALPGFPPHTLRRLPERVRSMAEVIEGLDGKIRSNQPYKEISQLLAFFLCSAIPKAEIEVRRGDNVLLQSVGTETRAISADSARNLLERLEKLPNLADLPNLLRLYADYVEALSKITAFYGSKGGKLLGRNMPHELVAFVEVSTGEPQWDKVTTLLNASYQAVGCDLEVDSKALGMQRTRSRK